MVTVLRSTLLMFVLLSALTGILYPLVVTAVTQVVFPHQAHGSVLLRDGKPIGSELFGQYFNEPQYFWGRPSATLPQYDGSSSSGSNLGPTNPDLIKTVKERVAKLRTSHPDQLDAVPVDLVTTSASGLDPHISPAAAEYQVTRIAKARGLPVSTVRDLVGDHTAGRTLGILGEPRVNVLRLNLALDAMRSQ